MSRSHIMPAGIWPPLVASSSRKLSQLDEQIDELVDAVQGGSTYSPVNSITIGGAGLTLNGFSEIDGGVTTFPRYGAGDPRIVLSDQWPQLGAARAVRRTMSFMTFTDGDQGVPPIFTSDGILYRSGGDLGTPSLDVNVYGAIANHTLIEGATLTKVACLLRYTGEKPDALGGADEAFSVYRRHQTTLAIDSLHTAGISGGTNYGGGGGAIAWRVVAGVDEFFNDGNVVSIVYEPNQNNVVDRSTYAYYVELQTSFAAEAIGVQLEFQVSEFRYE